MGDSSVYLDGPHHAAILFLCVSRKSVDSTTHVEGQRHLRRRYDDPR
jgi:hypothetical protein